MISGGNATIFVSDMERAVHLYTVVLGLKLEYRAGNEWASVDAGNGLKLGLHPEGIHTAKAGSRGAISVGLNVTEPIEKVVEALKSRGVKFERPIVDDNSVKLAFLADPDGNDLYLCEVKRY